MQKETCHVMQIPLLCKTAAYFSQSHEKVWDTDKNITAKMQPKSCQWGKKNV